MQNDYRRGLQDCVEMAKCLARAYREERQDLAEYFERRLQQKVEYFTDMIQVRRTQDEQK